MTYFVIGANGVGKTTLMQILKQELSRDSFTVYDFDERGVPDNADGDWRRSETLYWLQTAQENSNLNKYTIICGFSKPEEVQAAAESLNVPVAAILLDAAPEIIKERIMGRYLTPESRIELERTCGKTPEKFAQDSAWVSTKLRESAEKCGYAVLDTTNLNPDQVASKVIKLMNI